MCLALIRVCDKKEFRTSEKFSLWYQGVKNDYNKLSADRRGFIADQCYSRLASPKITE
jgi:hypothetical protein